MFSELVRYFHLTSPMFPYMGIRHVGAPRVWNLCKAHAISTLLVSVLRMFWSLKWIFPKKNSVRRWKKHSCAFWIRQKPERPRKGTVCTENSCGRSGYGKPSKRTVWFRKSSADRINRFVQLFSVGDKLLYEGAVQGFQRPTLGPVRNFDVVSGELIQLLHTGSDHWVCISSIGCLAGHVNLYNSLYHDIINQEVEEPD